MAIELRHLAAILFVLASSAGGASAEMTISPLRQVVSPDRPVATFEISNPTRRIVDARVSWIDLAATAEGYAVADSDMRARLSAAPYLTVRPANFRLEPGGRAMVTVAIKDGAAPPKGERRSHLLFEMKAARTPLRKASDNGLQVDIGLGVSTPVILRNGGAWGASIGETRLLRDDTGGLTLATSIVPEGTNSTFGALTVTFRPQGGAPRELAALENVAGYTDAETRRFETPLNVDALGAGKLTIAYEGRSEYDGVVFATRTFDIEPPPKN